MHYRVLVSICLTYIYDFSVANILLLLSIMYDCPFILLPISFACSSVIAYVVFTFIPAWGALSLIFCVFLFLDFLCTFRRFRFSFTLFIAIFRSLVLVAWSICIAYFLGFQQPRTKGTHTYYIDIYIIYLLRFIYCYLFCI